MIVLKPVVIKLRIIVDPTTGKVTSVEQRVCGAKLKKHFGRTRLIADLHNSVALRIEQWFTEWQHGPLD